MSYIKHRFTRMLNEVSASLQQDSESYKQKWYEELVDTKNQTQKRVQNIQEKWVKYSEAEKTELKKTIAERHSRFLFFCTRLLPMRTVVCGDVDSTSRSYNRASGVWNALVCGTVETTLFPASTAQSWEQFTKICFCLRQNAFSRPVDGAAGA